MKQPLVSVIVPAYNAGRHIQETIASVLLQSYRNIELIIVDDGSRDNTALIVKKYLDYDNRVHYIYQENEGQAAARKRGFEHSQGDLISFLDSDDLFALNKIEIQVRFMLDNPNCGVSYSDILHFWDNTPHILLRKKLTYYSGYIFDKLIRENVIQVMTALIRRDILIKYGLPGKEFRRSDDWYLWLNLSYHKVKFCFLDRILAFQRRHEAGSLSDQKTYFKETAERNIAIYKHFKALLNTEECKKYNIDNLLNFWQFRVVLGSLIMEDRIHAKKALQLFKIKGIFDGIKKCSLFILLCLVPVHVLGNMIYKLREFTRRRTFIPVTDTTITLPTASSLVLS